MFGFEVQKSENKSTTNSFLLVHGNWGEWTKFETCSASCEGGRQSRLRFCSNPRAANGGFDCLLSAGNEVRGKVERELKVCNTFACTGENEFNDIMIKGISKKCS